MKLTKIELKKYFKNPATYIISALLILVMLISIMVYKPTLESDVSMKKLYASYRVDVTDYNAVYNYFINSQSYLSQQDLTLRIYSCEDYLLTHDSSNDQNKVLLKLSSYINTIKEELNKNAPSLITVSSALNNFKELYTTTTNKALDSFTAVIKTTTKKNLDNLVNGALTTLSSAIPDATKVNELKNSNLTDNLTTNLSGIKNFLPSDKNFKIAQEYYLKGIAELEKLNIEIKNLPSKDGDVDTLFDYIQKFSYIVDYTYAIVTDEIKVSAISIIGENQAKNYSAISNINTYEYKESVTKNKYLLDYFVKNGTYLSYVEPINISYTYVNNVNIADYVGFVATLCTFIIIVYISVMGAISVNSEFKSGTMRMIATKPFKKSKIISGKIGATILYGLILLINAFIVSIVMGGIAYGFSTPPALIIFNASSAFCCSVYIELIIFLFTLIIQLLLFASLATMLSTLIGNNILAAIISCVLYLGSLIFNIVNINISFLPFTNINLWKYFGGSFLLNDNKNIFNLLFSSKPLATNTVIINIISFIVIIIIAQVITRIVFKKKEVR